MLIIYTTTSGNLVNKYKTVLVIVDTTAARPAALALASEQAFRGALAVEREKEGEPTTTSLEFEYLCGDDVNNDVITLGTCFSMFVYIRARFRFALIGGNLIAQSKGSRRGIGGGIKIQRLVSSPFSRPAAREPGRACSQATPALYVVGQ